MSKRGGIRLNLGCGVVLAPGFINVDKFFTLADLRRKEGIYGNAEVPDGAHFVQADLADLPFEDGVAEYVESIDCVEHLPFRDLPAAFAEMYRVLRPGGKLALMTSSFDNLARLWLDNMTDGWKPEAYEELVQLLYGNQLGPGEFHCNPFNGWIMKHYLEGAGFRDFKITVYPHNSTERPPIQTQEWGPETLYIRSDMLWVEAVK